VGIGQLEIDRPGDPNFDTQAFRFNDQIEPTGTFNVSLGSVSPTANATNEIGIHATQVAGVMISDGTLNSATGAWLRKQAYFRLQ